jgi:hypothetical protein
VKTMTATDPTECARVELARVIDLVHADPRYRPGVEGSFRRVARALVGHDTTELSDASEGGVWERHPEGGYTRHYLPEQVPAVVARLAALGPDPSLAGASSDEELHARICAQAAHRREAASVRYYLISEEQSLPDHALVSFARPKGHGRSSDVTFVLADARRASEDEVRQGTGEGLVAVPCADVERVATNGRVHLQHLPSLLACARQLDVAKVAS